MSSATAAHATLEARAGANVYFLGRQPRESVRELLRGCVPSFPGLEDFGIAPVEAMSCGRPVIAFGGGGALDTVIPGLSGELFGEPTVGSLMTLAHFDWRLVPAACRTQAECFSAENFRRQMAALGSSRPLVRYACGYLG